MKRILFVLIALFQISLLSLRAEDVDSLLLKEYQRGHEYVYEIIESNCLKDSLSNRPFCSLFFENLWSIIVKNNNSYVLYYGYQIGKEEVTRKEISNRDVVLNRLFSLDQKKIALPIYKRTDFYAPSYWYFVSSNFLHNTKFEWNVYSNSDDEYSKVCKDVISDYLVYLMIVTLDDDKLMEKFSKSIYKSRKTKD
ncbi:MAG: hypothetical protein IKX36_05725 [Prevotella sp.]|nr:hypothetical protein [Prevotella sp.]